MSEQNPARKTARSRVEPRLLKGFTDHLPAAAIRRRQLLEMIFPILELHGFSPVETPVVEHLDVLLGSGGEETNKELFRFLSPEEEPVALRFDLTVPFARLLAQYPDELKTPFRRYACGPVFRADKPGPGRFRQFTQLDMDAAGSADVAVDAEICSILCQVLRRLNLGGHLLEINSRRLMDAFLAGIGVAEADRQKAVLRVVDKLGKVGIANIRLELGPGRIDASGDPIPGLRMDPATIDRLVAFLEVSASTRLAVLEAVAPHLPAGKASEEALAELRELASNLDALGVSEAEAAFVPSLARGLDYYTGPVFEMKLLAAPQFGTVAAGGRYDGLVQRFSPNEVAATGASFGVDRLLAAMEALSPAGAARTTTRVLIVAFKGVDRAHYLRLASELRAAGVPTEVFFGKRKAGVTDQLAYANLKGIPIAVIAGEDELARGELAVKDLRVGAAARADLADREAYLAAGKAGQTTIRRDEVVSVVRQLLESEGGAA